MNRIFGIIRKPARQALLGGLVVLACAGCAPFATVSVAPAPAMHLDFEARPLASEGAAVVAPQPTRWGRSTDAASLWSAPEANARLFGDLPAGSLLQLKGSPVDGRTPVYYYGDGLSRQAGAAWVNTKVLVGISNPTESELVIVENVRNSALPEWVQAHKATTLWSGPDGQAVSLTDLPQWSYLHLSGVTRGNRVLVEYSGDYATRLKGIGWVDQSAVGPTGNPGEWVQNVKGSALYAGAAANSAKFTDLPAGAKLRVMDSSTSADRTLVEFFGDSQGRQAGQAWIPAADLQRIVPPSPLPITKPVLPAASPNVSSSTTASGRKIETYTFSTESDFIKVIGAAARKSQATTRVPSSVTVAQAILESNWGKSKLTRQANNLFGIKGTTGSAGSVTMPTWEHINGQDITVDAAFRAYYSFVESIDDHARFLQGPRYRPAMAVANDANAFARAIHAAGYATDPSYSDKLIKLMEKYNLYQFDA